MKKVLFGALAACIVFAGATAMAAVWGHPEFAPSQSVTIGPLSSSAASSPADLGMPIGYGKCTFTQVNGANSRTFILQGSNISAGTGFSNDVSVTVTSNPTTWAFFFQDDPNEFWRGVCASGCDTGNEITVECTFGGMAQ